MKKLAIIAVLALMLIPTASFAQASVNIGWVSEYIFRGVPQDDSSAYVGLDFEKSGFYVGTWAADVGQGSEVDLYFGYGGNISDDLSYGVGATGYFYTDDFDDTYKELNLSLGYLNFSLDAALGEYDNFSGATQDYSFLSLKVEHESCYLLVGSFGQDFDGEYVEAGYGLELGGLDLSLSIVHSSADLLGTSDNSIVFGIGKTLDAKMLGFATNN